MTRHLPFLLWAVMAAAGCSPNVTVPDPGVPGAKAPAVEYRSSFVGFQAFADDRMVPWGEANEAVKEGGGHTGHGAEPGGSKPAPKGAR